MEQAQPATSFDVASRAGVSRSTVSRIINGKGSRFPESTQLRVREAAEALDYQPSLAARALVSGRSDTVVVVLPNTTFGRNLQDAVDRMMVGAMPVGGNVVVRFAGPTSEATLAALMALRPLAVVDFGVLTSFQKQQLEQRGTITVPSSGSDVPDTGDGGIGELQASVLLKEAYRPLWYASLEDEREDIYGPRRLLALQTYCARNGFPSPGEVSVSLTVADGALAVEHILSGGRSAAVACYNDDVALTLLAGARSRGVKVPHRLSVIGVDNTFVGQLWDPPLTTIDTDLGGFVDYLARELRGRLSGSILPDLSYPRFTIVAGGTT